MDKKFRFCHSYWSAPADAKRWQVESQTWKNLCLFSLSVLLAKQNTNNYFTLHTDSKSLPMFEKLPYDNILTTLDSIKQSPVFWAAGKFEALKHEPIESIHFDGDVLFQKPLIAEHLKFDEDCMVQSTEYWVPRYFQSRVHTFYPDIKKDNPAYYCEKQYNTGIVAFNDQQLKDNWINWYGHNTAQVMKSPLFNSISLDDDVCFELQFEQSALYNLCKGKKVKELVNFDIPDYAKEIGYCHLVTRSKYMLINEVLEQIKRIDKRIYNYLISAQ